jgi:tRNA(His) 5'-end guanylyltransferase
VSDNTPLGDRMKAYEHTYRSYLPRRTYTLLRLDGRAFHSYMQGAVKPFDRDFMAHMDMTAAKLCEEIQGARLAYVQSDEISILLTDFQDLQSQPWFGGNVNKMLSIPASLAGAYMTRLRQHWPGLPTFDCRVWAMSDPVEVANYFVWRQRDAMRNSIQMVAQSEFSHGSLQGKNTDELQEMLFLECGINWASYPADCKRGRLLANVPDQGWLSRAAPDFKAAPGTELAELIPPLPNLWR